ncbi:unnamed protein product [Protopolystoma xenopodis]|uniref:Uncharacterized protein n=1 Tax=Protopolystoma xenopodis TaxID=117903 RepID=A0A448WD18_9PLAT|nr:unnamed protein product [Protopolystoma xenopodis]
MGLGPTVHGATPDPVTSPSTLALIYCWLMAKFCSEGLGPLSCLLWTLSMRTSDRQVNSADLVETGMYGTNCASVSGGPADRGGRKPTARYSNLNRLILFICRRRTWAGSLCTFAYRAIGIVQIKHSFVTHVTSCCLGAGQFLYQNTLTNYFPSILIIRPH